MNYVQAGFTGNETSRIADVNADGKPDLIWVYDGGGAQANSGTAVWLGNGDGTWQHAVKTDAGMFSNTPPQSGANTIQAGYTGSESFFMFDANNDGALDIVWIIEGGTNSGGTFRTGSWVLQSAQTLASGAYDGFWSCSEPNTSDTNQLLGTVTSKTVTIAGATLTPSGSSSPMTLTYNTTFNAGASSSTPTSPARCRKASGATTARSGTCPSRTSQASKSLTSTRNSC